MSKESKLDVVYVLLAVDNYEWAYNASISGIYSSMEKAEAEAKRANEWDDDDLTPPYTYEIKRYEVI